MYIKILSSSSELPSLNNDAFLHSAEMFSMLEKTSSVTPYMLVAFNDDGTVAAHMMVILRNRRWVIPPYFLTQGRVYGCGVYANEEQREEIFQELLTTANTLFRRKRCFYVEFSDMPHKIFGYSALRSAGYFPIPWLEVRNSLHSVHPKERLTQATAELIDKAVASCSTRCGKATKHGSSSHVATAKLSEEVAASIQAPQPFCGSSSANAPATTTPRQ